MLVKPAKKIESAHNHSVTEYIKKNRETGLSIIVILLFAIVLSFSLFFHEKNSQCQLRVHKNKSLKGSAESNSAPTSSECLRLETVSSSKAIMKGLSGRSSLQRDQGMLFVFEKPGKYCFWMKDMNFPIDIIWINESKKVVTVKENVKPESYPDSFCPSESARYVIEVNAGRSRVMQIFENSRLSF